MVCYVVTFPNGIDYGIISELDIKPIKTLRCSGSIIADVDEWQIDELTQNGCIIRQDNRCSL